MFKKVHVCYAAMLMSLLMTLCCLAMQSKEELEGNIQQVCSLKREKADAVFQCGQLQKQVTSLQKEMSDATELHGTTAQVGEALSVHSPCALHATCAPDSAPCMLHTTSLAWVHSTEPVMMCTCAYHLSSVTAVAMCCELLPSNHRKT